MGGVKGGKIVIGVYMAVFYEKTLNKKFFVYVWYVCMFVSLPSFLCFGKEIPQTNSSVESKDTYIKTPISTLNTWSILVASISAKLFLGTMVAPWKHYAMVYFRLLFSVCFSSRFYCCSPTFCKFFAFLLKF